MNYASDWRRKAIRVFQYTPQASSTSMEPIKIRKKALLSVGQCATTVRDLHLCADRASHREGEGWEAAIHSRCKIGDFI